MNPLEKALVKLTKKEQKTILHIIESIKKGNTKNLDIKKLKGYDDTFRARKGFVRIIFRVINRRPIILTVARRNETTYK